MERLIFHIDVNSAFLSWESARRVKQGLQDLRDIPACIGGDPKKRTGIVVAKSIPAKKYGIQTGEPMAMAIRKCPYTLRCTFAARVHTPRPKRAVIVERQPRVQSIGNLTHIGNISPIPVKFSPTPLVSGAVNGIKYPLISYNRPDIAHHLHRSDTFEFVGVFRRVMVAPHPQRAVGAHCRRIIGSRSVNPPYPVHYPYRDKTRSPGAVAELTPIIVVPAPQRAVSTQSESMIKTGRDLHHVVHNLHWRATECRGAVAEPTIFIVAKGPQGAVIAYYEGTLTDCSNCLLVACAEQRGGKYGDEEKKREKMMSFLVHWFDIYCKYTPFLWVSASLKPDYGPRMASKRANIRGLCGEIQLQRNK